MNQKSFVKRIMAVALSLIMVLGLMPMSAFALSVAPHTHPACGDSSCDDSAHAVNDSWTAWDGTTAFPGGNVCLSGDVILSSPLSITDTVNLCLNGHTISAAGGNFDVSGTLNLCSCGDNGIIKRTTTTTALISADAGATANLYNVTLDGGAVWGGTMDTTLLRVTNNSGTVSSSPLIDAGYQYTAGGHITLNSGVVLQNNECSDAGHGGAVTIGEDGTLVINGATIRNNAKTDGNAGAIKAYAGAQVTLNSGEIYGNSAYKHGGAFQIFGGASTDYADAVFTMNGGIIRNNKANGVGGGIAVSDHSKFIMNGGSIVDNATTDSQKRGGGVGFADANTAMSISGNAVISGNTANNLYIGTNSCNKLTVDTLGSGANIGVTMKSSSGGVFTIGGAADADKFVSDNSAYEVDDDGNNLKLVKQFTVSFDNNGGTGAKESVKVFDGDGYTLPLNPFTAPSGYQFKGWAKSANGNVISAEAITVTADTTLYAIWEKIPAEVPSVQISENLTLTYGEFTNQKITATVDKKDGYTYSYQWVNINNVVVETTDTLSIPDDLSAGTYDYACVVFAKREDNGESNSIVIRDIWVKVNVKAIDNNSAEATLSKTTFTYNGEEQKPDVTVTYEGKSLTEGTDYTLDWSADCKNAGLKTVTVNFKGNYSGSAQETFVIAKAPLTVTANNKTITYGDAPAHNGVTYSGFTSNENADVLGGTLVYSNAYNQYGNVGDYDITVSGLTSDNYEITFVKGTLTVEQRQISIHWGATEFIPYNGSKQVPEVTAGNLVNNDSCDLTVEVVETAEGAGVIPGRWNARITALSNGNYCLPKDGRLVQVDYSISKGYQNAPIVSGVAETIKGKADGKITGLTTEMEYATEFTADDDKYTKVTNANMNFAPGTYYVRYQAKGYYNPSIFTEVTIGEGRKLTVTLPQNQIGYTLTVDKSTLDWQEEFTLTYTLKEGYTELSNFAVEVNGSPVTLAGGKYTATNLEADIVITVTGVADITAPTVQISVKDNKWSSFWNSLTFGLFFNESQDVTITATDAGSGVNTIQYYLATDELELDEVRAITIWQDYNGTFKIEPNSRYIVYAKVTDHAGNTLYINSDGMILDSIAPTLEGIEDGQTYYGDLTVIKPVEQFYDIKTVTLDGVPMSFAEGTYGLIPADNAEHTVVVEDHAGNKTIYTVTVYKNYTVTFKIDGNTINTQTVGYGKDATVPAIPEKEGYTQTAPAWDKDGKNITADTEINAVYTINEYTITFTDENGVYKTLTVKHGEAVTMPEVPTKDGYTVTWETTIDKATGDATVKAVYTEKVVSDSPQTGDNSYMMLWIELLLISGGAVITLTVYDRKRRTTTNK